MALKMAHKLTSTGAVSLRCKGMMDGAHQTDGALRIYQNKTNKLLDL
jgi:hypothetical protein